MARQVDRVLKRFARVLRVDLSPCRTCPGGLPDVHAPTNGHAHRASRRHPDKVSGFARRYISILEAADYLGVDRPPSAR